MGVIIRKRAPTHIRCVVGDVRAGQSGGVRAFALIVFLPLKNGTTPSVRHLAGHA
jgi:hypothetical protein